MRTCSMSKSSRAKNWTRHRHRYWAFRSSSGGALCDHLLHLLGGTPTECNSADVSRAGRPRSATARSCNACRKRPTEPTCCMGQHVRKPGRRSPMLPQPFLATLFPCLSALFLSLLAAHRRGSLRANWRQMKPNRFDVHCEQPHLRRGILGCRQQRLESVAIK